MSAVHAGPAREQRLDLCAWIWDSDGAHLYCSDRALPGGTECADHLIQRMHPATTAPGWVHP